MKILLIAVLCILFGCVTPDPDFKRTPQTDLLRARDFKKVLIEVSYFEKLTREPSSEDLKYLQEKVMNYCHKDSVVIHINDAAPITSLVSLVWDTSTLRMQERTITQLQSAGDTLVVHAIYVPGFYISKLTVRGLAYGDASFVIFSSCVGIANERSTLLHEFGHLMGLVNCGCSCQTAHEEPDPEHKLHCASQRCVMYWCSPEGSLPDFDEPCKADLRANGGR